MAMNLPPSFTFPVSEKLKSRKELEALYAEGRSLSAYPLRLIYLAADPARKVPVQVAISAPKRKMKAAHDRNRMKRLVREAWRHHKHPLLSYCREHNKTYNLLFISQCNTPAGYTQVEEKLTLLLKRLIQDDQKSAE